MGYNEEYFRWRSAENLSESEREELVSIEENEDIVQKLFGEDLKFGTAGLRGICGLGTARMNVHTVRRATQGLAEHLKKQYYNPSAVISYDSRLDSESFAKETAAVLTANGIQTYIFSEMMPVPVLSYAVRSLNCSAGIMITASHNSKEYNGYKVYNHTGGQILEQEAERIQHEIENVDIFEDIKTISFETAMKQGCRLVPEDVYAAYLNEADQATCFTGERNIKIVYTPLNGTGRKAAVDLLKRKEYSFYVVPEQEQKDGNFPTCPYPNPEKEEVYELAQKYGREQAADILIATDPDCDRVGVMAKHREEYELLTGNQIGTLLFQYLCENGRDVFDKRLYTSMVSTPMTDRIAVRYGVKVKRTPVGFKHIGHQIDLAPEAFLFGFEESNGYLTGSYCRDKDGAAAAVLICEMAAWYKKQGLDLIDALEDMYRQYGCILDETLNLQVNSLKESEQMMERLRDTDRVYQIFSGIESYIDYQDSFYQKNYPRMNVLEIRFVNGSRIIVRPSGTEPKIKIYLSASEKKREDCVVQIREMKNKLQELLL